MQPLGLVVLPWTVILLSTLRASDPEEIYKIHELKMKKEQAVTQESHLDQLIQMCKQELSLLMENQENWQYPDCRTVVWG